MFFPRTTFEKNRWILIKFIWNAFGIILNSYFYFIDVVNINTISMRTSEVD